MTYFLDGGDSCVGVGWRFKELTVDDSCAQGKIHGRSKKSEATLGELE